MSKSVEKTNEFLEALKSNYSRNFGEIDKFSRDFSNASDDFRTQCMAGLSDLLQYYLDLQKKFANDFPLWFNTDLVSRQSMMITEAWLSSLRNMISSYSSVLDSGSKNMKIFDKGMRQIMEMAEMYHDMIGNASP